MENILKPRSEVPEQLKWDLSLLYKTEQEYENDLSVFMELGKRLTAYKGTLSFAEKIAECLALYESYCEKKHLLSCYTALSLSVEYGDSTALERDSYLSGIVSSIDSSLCFIDSELMNCESRIIEEAIQLQPRFKGYLTSILRKRPYRLPQEAELVLTAFSEVMAAPYSFYEQLKLSDTKFDPFTVNGISYPLDYSLYEDSYEYDARTDVRRAAFHAFSKTIAQHENSTACAYNTEVRRQKIESDMRGFPSVFDSLLFEQRVTREMYDRQIDLIMNHLAPHMRKYAALIKRVNKLDRITFADLKAPIDPEFHKRVTMSEAKSMVIESLSVLGEDYSKLVESAFKDRWIDFARNEGKSTGGFCESPYGKNSYILMTWNECMSDVFTLAHELGHAGHFDACNKEQSIFDTDVSLYFVEAPSTMNELLFGHAMLQKTADPRERRYILSCMIGDTYFHNMVTHLIEAAYQREVYKIVDAGGSVHADTLNRIMGQTLRAFWGEDVEIDRDAEHTWMRQPHYYMGLYSYTYSAGLTVATQVCDRILNEGTPAIEDWKRVLRAGGTKDPVQLAAMAGVDITTDSALLKTIEKIGSMIDEIESLTNQIEAV